MIFYYSFTSLLYSLYSNVCKKYIIYVYKTTSFFIIYYIRINKAIILFSDNNN